MSTPDQSAFLDPVPEDGLETSDSRWGWKADPHAAQNHARAAALEIAAAEYSQRGHHPEARRLRRIADGLVSCSKTAWVWAAEDRSTCGVSIVRCKSRLCEECSVRRSIAVTAKVRHHLREMDARRFLTLTIRHKDQPLDQLLAHLRHSWRRLRQRKWWRQRVKGGVWTIEVKWSARSGGWHPHIHAIIDGEFIPRDKLAALWHDITGDSHIVDIRHVHDARTAARYMSKYIAKPGDVQALPHDQIGPYALAIQGLRLIHTWGHLHAVNTTPEEDEPRPRCERVVTLNELARRARGGQEQATDLLHQWQAHLRGVCTVPLPTLLTRTLIAANEDIIPPRPPPPGSPPPRHAADPLPFEGASPAANRHAIIDTLN